MSSPIADLRYRPYDGPLNESAHRGWWSIAKLGIMSAFKKRSYWVLMTVGAWFYIIIAVVLFFTTGLVGNDIAGQQILGRIVWKDQFVHGFSYGQLFYMIIGLLVGIGSIANDNRANALLVYLSKPLSRGEYLVGKFMGVFIPLFLVMWAPAMMFYVYILTSYSEHGAFTEDRLMAVRLTAVAIVTAGFYTCLLVGFSGFSRQSRLAGAAFAGLYFVANLFKLLMNTLYQAQGDALAGRLYYASIDGIGIGIAKFLLGTDGTVAFGAFGGDSEFGRVPPRPDWWLLAIGLGLALLLLLATWRRIRAVEVVR